MMSSNAVIDFFKKAQSDRVLSTELAAAVTLENIVDLAKENGFEFTLKQLEIGLKATLELQDNLEISGELADVDLETVSGGISDEWQELLMNQNHAFDIMNDFIKKMQASRSSIINNMR